MLGGVFLAAQPTAAQFGENTEMLCGTGADAAYVFIMSMLVLYGLVMSGIQGGFGLVNLHNTDEDKHRKGEQGLKSAGTSAAVVLIPILLTVFIEAIGVAVASCFVPDIGVLGGDGGGEEAAIMLLLATPARGVLTEETD